MSSEEICGEELTYGEGVCDYTPDYPDGKCGLHSEHTSHPRKVHEIQHPVIEEWLEREKRDLRDDDGNLTGTYDSRLTAMRAFDQWRESAEKELTEIGPISIGNYIDWLTTERGRNISDNTAKDYLDNLSKLFQYLESKEKEEYGQADVFEDNPVRDADIDLDTAQSEMAKNLKNEEGYVAISQEEFEQLLEHIPAPKFRWELLFSIIWDCGLRPVEATDIMIEDINQEKREIKIRSEKTHINRSVFYGEKVAQMLDIYLNGGERDRFLMADDSEYLFITNQSEKLTTTAIQEAYRKAAIDSGIDEEPVYQDANGNDVYRTKPYSLRHGMAEKLIDKPEIDTVLLRDAMGHKSVTTTEMYLNRDKETRRRKIQDALGD